jgi:pilus assembly protein TadC
MYNAGVVAVNSEVVGLGPRPLRAENVAKKQQNFVILFSPILHFYYSSKLFSETCQTMSNLFLLLLVIFLLFLVILFFLFLASWNGRVGKLV